MSKSDGGEKRRISLTIRIKKFPSMSRIITAINRDEEVKKK
jgi:hypothetical protein